MTTIQFTCRRCTASMEFLRRVSAFAVLAAKLGLAVVLWSGGLALSAEPGDPLSTWSPRDTVYGTTNDWRGIAYGHGRFVVCGTKGAIVTSPDGVQWTPHPADTMKHFYGVTFGGGTFVAAGNSGQVFTSLDGEQWQKQDSGTSAHLYHVSHQNGLFVAVGGGGTILSSPDGAIWSSHGTGYTNQWEASCFGNGTHVVVGYRTQTPNIHTRTAASPTLGDWSLADSGASHYLSGVAFGRGKFVAVGYGGLLQTSTDGMEWSAPARAAFEWLYFATFAHDTFMAVGEDIIVSSNDGTTWTNRFVNNRTVIEGIAFGGNTWVAVGREGLILQSGEVLPEASSEVRLDHTRVVGDEIRFEFDATPGVQYAVQSSLDLKAWNTVTNLTAGTAPLVWTQARSAQPACFYRVAGP